MNFICETKMERDEWFEVLVNSRTTAKTYKFSITKHPKNVDGLNNLLTKDRNGFYQKISSDLFKVLLFKIWKILLNRIWMDAFVVFLLKLIY